MGAHRSGIAFRLVPSNNLRKIYGMGLKKRDIERSVLLIKRDDLEMNWNMYSRPVVTFLSIVFDINRSAAVPDNILPEDPGTITQVFVIDNLHPSLQNLCENISET